MSQLELDHRTNIRFLVKLGKSGNEIRELLVKVYIRSNTMAALKAIPQNQFQNCFEGSAKRWHRCIASQGEYFEGDYGGIQQ